MKPKALFLDIDGTLILRSRFPFKEDTDAMEEAAAEGHFIFLNTGRSFANIPPALLALPSVRGIAAGGGAHILLPESPGGADGFRTVYHKWAPREILDKLFTLYGKVRRCCVLEGERDCYIINPIPGVDTIRPSFTVATPEDFAAKSRGDLISKITLAGFPEEEEMAVLQSFFTVNCFATYSEGIIKGENKAKAMKIILEKTGLGREDSIAVGDSANDLDMIRYAGLGVAMGNAREELKQAAGEITGNCGEGGVARVIRAHLLRRLNIPRGRFRDGKERI